MLASYFEWRQNVTNKVLTDQQLEQEFSQKILYAWNKVYDKYFGYEQQYDLRTIAYLLAIERLLK